MHESYYLLIAYHGFWFIPRPDVNFLYRRFKKKSKWELYVFSYFLEKVLFLRSFTITQYLLMAITRFKQKGLIFVIKKIYSKAKNKITRSIVTTASRNASILDEEALYKRK